MTRDPTTKTAVPAADSHPKAPSLAEQMLESAPDAIVVVDQEGRIASVNGQMERLLGHERGSLVGEPVEVLIPERYRIAHVTHRTAYTNEPRPRPMGAGFDLTARHKDGHEVPVEISLSPIHTDDGILVMAAIRDVTQRQTEEARMQLLRTLPIAMSEAADERDALDIAVQQVCRATAWPVGEAWLLGADALVRHAAWSQDEPGYRRFVESRHHDRFAAGEGLPGSVLAAGEPVWIEHLVEDLRFARPGLASAAGLQTAAGIPVFIEGRPLAVLVFFQAEPRLQDKRFLDLLSTIAVQVGTTLDKKRHERELQERTAALERANRELEAFSYSVSHDLRTPLITIDGLVTMVLEDRKDELGAEATQDLEHVLEACEKMDTTMKAILNLSRLSRSEVRPQRLDVTTLARRLVHELIERSPGRQVQVTVEEGLEAHGDPGLVQVALENLLSNAWKYTMKTADARIEVARDTLQGEPCIRVSDNGVGFPGEHTGKLFLPFERLGRNTEFDGLGIGLATVYRIVERHGGRIVAEGQQDGGATFRFTLAPGLDA